MFQQTTRVHAPKAQSSANYSAINSFFPFFSRTHTQCTRARSSHENQSWKMHAAPVKRRLNNNESAAFHHSAKKKGKNVRRGGSSVPNNWNRHEYPSSSSSLEVAKSIPRRCLITWIGRFRSLSPGGDKPRRGEEEGSWAAAPSQVCKATRVRRFGLPGLPIGLATASRPLEASGGTGDPWACSHLPPGGATKISPFYGLFLLGCGLIFLPGWTNCNEIRFLRFIDVWELYW